MSKMETVTIPEFGDIEVDTEACSEFGFAAGDRVAPAGHSNFATVLGVASVPASMQADCMSNNEPLLWVRGDEGQVCFVPSCIIDQLVKEE
jgi:hypothetical protein